VAAHRASKKLVDLTVNENNFIGEQDVTQ
jgi:hypothetical protein